MFEQGSLFDAKPYRVETRKPRVTIPVTGVEWRRTALRRDCEACWQQQHDEYRASGKLTMTRQAASAELRIWSDEGELTHHGFYCTRHGEALGWDSSRVGDPRRKKAKVDAEAIVRGRLAADLNELARQAKQGRITSRWGDSLAELIGRAGGHGLEMPDWHVDAKGRLEGRFRQNPVRHVHDWAERFGSDVETEPCLGQTCFRATCLVVTSPAFRVGVLGFAERIATTP
ncbi:MAG: hypothetical protein ACREX3_15270 [Gammaproteobacteria bacterium]